MTALPSQPRHLLTVTDYLALGEDPDGVRYELQEGSLLMSPKPVPEHQIAVMRLARQLEKRVPPALVLVADVDIDLQLVPPNHPGTVRAPDLVAVTRAGLARRRSEGGVLRASEVVLAVEVVSPGSRRLDKVFKHSEYADAGIPYYWVVDLGEPGDRVTLTAHHLAGEFGYMNGGSVTGVFAATEPFPVRVDLDALV